MWIWYILLTSGPGPNLAGSPPPPGHPITAATCSVAGNFTCEDGQCVPGAVRCDGRPDCFDNSDEKGCSRVIQSKCSPTFFPCANGVHCIIGRFHCNGFPDCPDGSDEHDCEENAELCASASRFHCNNGRCVHRSFLCNGDDNCRDNSDEDNCELTTVAAPHRDLSQLDYSGMTGVVTCCALFIGLLSALFGLVLHHQRKRGILTGGHGTHGTQARHRRHQPLLLLSHFVVLDPGYPRLSPPSTAPSSPSPFSCSPQARPLPAGSPPSYSEAALDSSYPSWFDLPPPPYLADAVGLPQTTPDLPTYEASVEQRPSLEPPPHDSPAHSPPNATPLRD
ncbi:low-density lipoprotein receptor class A domain-containing protein 3-like [Sardina pilchardus]|uniref:low-density lipoprotein receptor class A domain-containing protein 3-like n=1 Tax=Sardina pilchardus TaxID=27697 RepID=UPI002E1033E9